MVQSLHLLHSVIALVGSYRLHGQSIGRLAAGFIDRLLSLQYFTGQSVVIGLIARLHLGLHDSTRV